MRKVKLKYQHFHPPSLHYSVTLLFFIVHTQVDSTKKAKLEGTCGDLYTRFIGNDIIRTLSRELFKKFAVI